MPENHLTIHFIGIGGVGMSGLAKVMFENGYNVSGSDQTKSSRIQALEAQGVQIFTNQTEKNIEILQRNNQSEILIVISSAIKQNNPELKKAKELGIKIWHRSDLLAALIENNSSIVIAGSHGKTTTSTIITTLLSLTGKDPTAVIGGKVPYYKSNAHTGKNKLLVAEADESDGSLIKFKPTLGVITNLELEHPDHYKNLKELINTIKLFEKQCAEVICNYDCPTLKNNFKPNYWWSIETNKNVDFSGIPVRIESDKIIAKFYEKLNFIDEIEIPSPGIHNLSNVIAAISVCRLQGIPFKEIKKYLSSIKRPGRRFEYKGIWRDLKVFDDYGHHPTEIKATIKMARGMIKTNRISITKDPKRLLVVFQPHRYSRTNKFLKDFAKSLSKADVLILAPTYSAGEKYLEGSDSQTIAKEIIELKANVKIFIGEDLNHVVTILKNISMRNDLILIMGAGDINLIWNLLQEEENESCQNIITAA